MGVGRERLMTGYKYKVRYKDKIQGSCSQVELTVTVSIRKTKRKDLFSTSKAK